MPAVESTLFPIGEAAPAFSLPDAVSGQTLTLADIAGDRGTVVMFLCNHCPFVKHVQAQLVRLAHDYQAKGIGFVAISSNDVANYPQDGPEHMKAEAQAAGYPFPYLYDESQAIARAYQAACTPDFYLFDGQQRCYYRGRLDAARPGAAIPNDGRALRAALDGLLAGAPAPVEQMPSIGCSIKWK